MSAYCNLTVLLQSSCPAASYWIYLLYDFNGVSIPPVASLNNMHKQYVIVSAVILEGKSVNPAGLVRLAMKTRTFPEPT
jgi:hypothetical protein